MSDPGKSSRLAAALLTGACLGHPLAVAQTDTAKNYPNKPVRFLVTVTAGGGPDATARAIAQKLTEAWGYQFIVENRTGATGAIAVDFTAKAVPDGHTICVISGSQTVNSAVNSRLPYDLTKDLAAISRLSSLFYVVYHGPSVPVKSLNELITYAKLHPGKLHYGTPGTGSMQHFAVEMFNHMSGAKLVHVPYKGGPPAIAAVLAGDVQVGFATLFGLRPHISSGRLRLLAITAKERSPVVPELPTIAESGVPGYEADQWYGVVTSARVPPAIINKLNAAIVEALKSPDVIQRLGADGSAPVSSSPEVFAAHIKSEIAKWRKLARDTQLPLN